MKRPTPGVWLGISVCLLFLTALIFLPRLLGQQDVQLLFQKPRESLERLSLDRRFPVVKSGVGMGAVTLAELAAKSPAGLLLNFWATWCPPCLEELPSLEALERQRLSQPDKIPRVVAISVDEAPTDVVSLVRTLGYRFDVLVLLDRDGEFSRSLGTVKFPETYWVASDGKLMRKWVGPQDWIGGDVLAAFAAGVR